MEVVCVFSKYVFWSKLWYGLKTLYEAFVWAFVKGLSKRVTSWVVSQILCSRRDTYFILIPKLFVILQSKGVTVDKLNRRVFLVDCGKEMPLSISVSFLIWNEAYTAVVFNPTHFWIHDTRVWDARTSVWPEKKMKHCQQAILPAGKHDISITGIKFVGRTKEQHCLVFYIVEFAAEGCDLFPHLNLHTNRCDTATVAQDAVGRRGYWPLYLYSHLNQWYSTFFLSRTPRYIFSSTFYPQSCWCVI